ncbi:hypothetical protein AB1Y20_007184 [Prymnesium parvum]|uniref:AP2/ERF domain-containing protein n=1 Tax=Prymnesium parvum TaxID=97485 RepID=A0AB34IWE7_PRYPA
MAVCQPHSRPEGATWWSCDEELDALIDELPVETNLAQLFTSCAKAREVIQRVALADNMRNGARCQRAVASALSDCVAISPAAAPAESKRPPSPEIRERLEPVEVRTARPPTARAERKPASAPCKRPGLKARKKAIALMLEKEFAHIAEPIRSASSKTGFKGVYPARNGRFQAQFGHRAIGGYASAWLAGVAVARAEACWQDTDDLEPSDDEGRLRLKREITPCRAQPAAARMEAVAADPVSMVNGWFADDVTVSVVAERTRRPEEQSDGGLLADRQPTCGALASSSSDPLTEADGLVRAPALEEHRSERDSYRPAEMHNCEASIHQLDTIVNKL